MCTAGAEEPEGSPAERTALERPVEAVVEGVRALGAVKGVEEEEEGLRAWPLAVGEEAKSLYFLGTLVAPVSWSSLKGLSFLLAVAVALGSSL